MPPSLGFVCSSARISPAPALPSSEGTPSRGPRACVLGARAPASAAYQRGRIAQRRRPRTRSRRPAAGPAARAPRGRPRGSGTRTWPAATTWSRLMTRTNTQAPIVGFTPIRLPGSPGAHDHGDRRHDVEGREHEVAGAGQPGGPDGPAEGLRHRPPLVDGDDRREHEQVEPDHERPHLQQDAPSPVRGARPKKLDSVRIPTPTMQTANDTGSARIARRRHAGRDAAVLERLDDGGRSGTPGRRRGRPGSRRSPSCPPCSPKRPVASERVHGWSRSEGAPAGSRAARTAPGTRARSAPATRAARNRIGAISEHEASRGRSRPRASAPSGPEASRSTPAAPGANIESRIPRRARGRGRGLRVAVAAGPGRGT